MNNHYFSIIIPLYNKVSYVERAINSILNQKYQNFEIIIVNDGSTDGGDLLVQSIFDKRISIINQINQGVSVARNNGAAIAKYDFLAFLDADDVWFNTFLEVANLLINKYPNVGLYGFNNNFQYYNGKTTCEKYDWLFGGEQCGIIKDYFDIFVKLGRSPFSNSSYCISKDIFLAEGGYKEGVKLTEDSDLWSRVALKYDIAFSALPLAINYVGTTGSTHFIFEPNNFQITRTLRLALNHNKVKPSQIKSVKKLISFQQLSLIKRSILTGNRLFAFKNLLNAGLICYYPFSYLKCLMALVVPMHMIMSYRKRKYDL